MKWFRARGKVLIRQPRLRSFRCRFFRPQLEWLECRRAPAVLPAQFVNAEPLNNSGQVLQGTLTGDQPQDYSVTVTGDTFLLATAAAQSSPGFEPRLTLYAGTGQLLIQSDQQQPGLASDTLEQHLQAGTYFLEVSAAPSSSAAAGPEAYQLTTALTTSLPPFASIPVGVLPGAITVANLGNGHPDIVVVDSLFGTVSVLLGNGDGTFQPAQSYGAGFQPEAITVADLGNGHPDIVTANSGGNSVSVLLGNGDGTFQTAKSFAVGSGPAAVAVADLGNGRPDIVTANSGDNTVSVLLGNGDGTFQTAESYAVGSEPIAVAAMDVNGDGRPDIVTANYGANTVSVLQGEGGGKFKRAQSFAVGRGPGALAVADLGNGQADIVTANRASDTVSVLLGQGHGKFKPARSIAVGSSPFSIAVADLGNGQADIIVTAGDDTVSVLLGNGNGTFQPAQSFVAGSESDVFALADLGNGRPDIIAVNFRESTVSVLLGNGDGTFQSASSFAVGMEPAAVVVADLGNGQSDIVTANNLSNTVSVLLGNGDGTFQPAVSYAVGNGPDGVAVVDVNGDGRPDIVIANKEDNTVSVLLGNGDGTFQPAHSFAVGTTPNAVAVADLGNGEADIVTASDGNTVFVLLGTGDGSFQADPFSSPGLPPGTFAVGDEPNGVTVADLGNGHIDIVAANGIDGTVSVLLGDGKGRFRPAPFSSPGLPPGTFAVGGDPHAVAVADIGNGRADIVTANYGDNTVSVLLGNGAGDFTPDSFSSAGLTPGTFAVGMGPGSLAVADLGNGQLDLVTANYNDNTVSVLLGNGDGTFQPALSFAVGNEPTGVAVANLAGDGLPDLVTSNFYDNTVSVLLNQGNAQFQPPTTPSGTPSRDIPQLQDYTGDGIADALSLDQRTGQILFRQGTGEADNPFDPFVVINPNHPATDFTLVQTPGLPEIAALDADDREVFLYAWSSSAGQFQQVASFATGPQPVCIASADLDGNGLADIVVGNYQDDTLTIALQQSPGTFETFTRNVGAGPSSITFADLNGDGLPDIVVSDQVSGDVSILFNDASCSFTTQERYRAGQGPFDVNTGPNGTTILSQLQTIDVVAGDFTGTGSTDLIALDANTDSFTLLRAAGDGSLIDPQFADTYSVGPGAVQALAGDFLHDGHLDLAVLVTRPDGTSQVLVFPNNGNGTFGDPIVSAAGADATGFSFVPGTAGQQDRLVIGNDYGDFLILHGDDTGRFQVDRSGMNGQPLAVIQRKNGPPLVVVANEQTRQVQVFVQSSSDQTGAGAFTALGAVRVPTSSITGVAPAPGSVLLTDLNKDGIPDLVVADRLGNDILVFQGNANGTFSATPYIISVGFEPDAIAVGDFNSDGVPDLAVANEGSNDVSILLGAIKNGHWTATHGPRLNSGGSEPLAIEAGTFTGRRGILDLRVVNAGGQIATIPGIGSAARTAGGSGKGTGFFHDNSVQNGSGPPIQIINLPDTTIVEVASDISTGETFVVLSDGTLESFNGTTFTADTRVSGVTQISAEEGELAVGLTNGVEVMNEVGGAPELPSEEFTDQPSALQVLQTEQGLEVIVTIQGSDVPLLLTGFTTLPVVIDVPRSASFVEATSLPEANLVLLATVLAGELVEPSAVVASQPIAGEQLFGVFLPPVPFQVKGENLAPGGDDPAREIAVQAEMLPLVLGENAPEWQTYRLGAEDALIDRLRRQQAMDNLQDMFDVIQRILKNLQSELKVRGEQIHLEIEAPVEETASEPVPDCEPMERTPDRAESCLHEALPRQNGEFLGGQEDRHAAEARGEHCTTLVAALLVVEFVVRYNSGDLIRAKAPRPKL